MVLKEGQINVRSTIAAVWCGFALVHGATFEYMFLHQQCTLTATIVTL